jgi:hypothetical protein
VRKTPLKSKPKQSTLKSKADSLAAAFCKKERRCQAQGQEGIRCSDRMEWAHLKSRSHGHIRHDPLNALCLCNTHHRFYTNHPDLWVEFVEREFPGRWEFLNRRLQETHGKKPDYAAWIEFYREVE